MIYPCLTEWKIIPPPVKLAQAPAYRIPGVNVRARFQRNPYVMKGWPRASIHFGFDVFDATLEIQPFGLRLGKADWGVPAHETRSEWFEGSGEGEALWMLTLSVDGVRDLRTSFVVIVVEVQPSNFIRPRAALTWGGCGNNLHLSYC